MKFIAGLVAGLILAFGTTGTAAGTSVLFIGNSFLFGSGSAVRFYRADTVTDLNSEGVGGVPALFKSFTQQAGLDYDVSLETRGGIGLDFHLENKLGVIGRRGWDTVIMHGYSTLDAAKPRDPEKLVATSKGMAAFLRTLVFNQKLITDELVEERFWWRMGLRQIYSGQPDKVLVVRNRAYLPDLKTGWHPLDAVAATNCQLRSEVPLVYQNIEGIDEITVDIIKPGKMTPPAVFDKDLILQASTWALNTVQRIRADKEKKPNRGPWCQYCAGKVLCPAWQQELKALSLPEAFLEVDPADEVLRELGPRLDLIVKVVERLKWRLEQRVREAPKLFPGWRFDKGDLRRRIVSLTLAWQKLSAEGISANDFISCCNGAVTELESVYRHKKGLRKVDAAAAFNKLMANSIELKPNKDKLVYIPSLPESEVIDAGPKSMIESADLPFQ